jgi:uncharacterized metal-binding protein YceD (DUF177 family)
MIYDFDLIKDTKEGKYPQSTEDFLQFGWITLLLPTPKFEVMNSKKEFEIPFVGLKPGIHVFEYKIEDKFFKDYDEQDFTECNVNVKLSLDKKQGFFQLKFDIDGSVKVVCDKCSNAITKNLWDEFEIVVKMVTEPETMNDQEEDPDIYYISHNDSHLNVCDWIFEFINLSIPLQKICKEEEFGGELCNKEVLARLKQMEEEAMKDIKIDNVWKGLDKFKDL